LFETDLSQVDGYQRGLANRQALLRWQVTRLLNTMGISGSNLQKKGCIVYTKVSTWEFLVFLIIIWLSYQTPIIYSKEGW
jgi:hypothetical protein